MARASEQIRKASDKLAFVIVRQLTALTPGPYLSGFEGELADALDAYGRAVAFLAEQEITSELAGSLPVDPSR